MSLPTRDSRQHQTTKLSQQRVKSRPSGKHHHAWIGSTLQGLEGSTFGLVIVTSSKLRRVNGYIYIRVKCMKCHQEKWISKDNLLNGKTPGCQSCAHPQLSEARKRLGWRWEGMTGRCNYPQNPAYPRYGGRGVKVLFKSRYHFINYMLENLPHQDYRGVEIDRIDNNGHYAPGNIRLATRSMQNRNKTNNLWFTFQGKHINIWDFDSPYERSWTQRLIQRGMTGEQIIANAQQHAHKGACKRWKYLKEWLEKHGYMTS